MNPESFERFFVRKEGLELELEELKTLKDKRDLLQQHLSELFENMEDIESKYSTDAKFDEQKKYRSDRSFLTPEDKEEYDTLKEGMDVVEVERDAVDREILKKRFDLGLKYISEINRQEDVVWKEISEHKPDPKNNPDTYNVYSKQWRVKIGDNIAEFSMFGEFVPSFEEELKKIVHAAAILEGTTPPETLKNLPEERKIDFTNVRLSFSIGHGSASNRESKELIPGFEMSKRFDRYDEALDSVEVHPPLGHAAYAFPEINKEEQEHAKAEMIILAEKLGITYF